MTGAGRLYHTSSVILYNQLLRVPRLRGYNPAHGYVGDNPEDRDMDNSEMITNLLTQRDGLLIQRSDVTTKASR